MKKVFLKNIIATIIATIAISTWSTVSAHAIWNKDLQNRWNWTENGVKSKGWKNVENKWYYFDENGIMKIGWLKDSDGYWYHLLGSGAMSTGWLKDKDEKWYHLSKSGAMSMGWLDDSGSKYYLGSSGAMLTGRVTISGKVYILAESGALIREESSDNSNNINSNEIRTGYVATQSGEVNVRNEASLSSSVIGTLLKGTKLTIFGQPTKGFFKMSANGFNGWVSKDWISFEKPTSPQINLDKNTNVNLGEIRTTPPSINDKHYYSDDNIFYRAKYSPPFNKVDGSPIIGNCTWYVWGRIWELTGQAPNDANFIGNAYEWWAANKKTGKYKTGSTAKVGAIAVWKSSLPGSGGFGHVAVVEKIENNKIYISESSWHGSLFKYREIYNTDYMEGYMYIN